MSESTVIFQIIFYETLIYLRVEHTMQKLHWVGYSQWRDL